MKRPSLASLYTEALLALTAARTSLAAARRSAWRAWGTMGRWA